MTCVEKQNDVVQLESAQMIVSLQRVKQNKAKRIMFEISQIPSPNLDLLNLLAHSTDLCSQYHIARRGAACDQIVNARCAVFIWPDVHCRGLFCAN